MRDRLSQRTTYLGLNSRYRAFQRFSVSLAVPSCNDDWFLFVEIAQAQPPKTVGGNNEDTVPVVEKLGGCGFNDWFWSLSTQYKLKLRRSYKGFSGPVYSSGKSVGL